MRTDFKLGVTLGFIFIFSLQVIHYVFRLRSIVENAKNAEDRYTDSKLVSSCVSREVGQPAEDKIYEPRLAWIWI